MLTFLLYVTKKLCILLHLIMDLLKLLRIIYNDHTNFSLFNIIIYGILNVILVLPKINSNHAPHVQKYQ